TSPQLVPNWRTSAPQLAAPRRGDAAMAVYRIAPAGGAARVCCAASRLRRQGLPMFDKVTSNCPKPCYESCTQLRTKLRKIDNEFDLSLTSCQCDHLLGTAKCGRRR